jgi:hypothetical protein
MAEQMVLPLGEAAKSCIAGARFGKWTVLGDAPKRHGNRYTLVRCDCGEQRSVQQNTLVAGRSKSCRGCSGLELQCSAGDRFGCLTMLGELPREQDVTRRVWVRCDCGTTKAVALSKLFGGETVSCGCYAAAALSCMAVYAHSLH